MFSIRMTIIAGATVVNVAVHFTKVFIVHFGSAMRVAFKAGECFSVSRLKMAGGAFIPFVIVYARENWEIEIVVVHKIAFLAIRMAKMTLCTVVGISLNPGMPWIHFRLTMLMTICTGKLFSICRIRVAVEACLPLSEMCARENWEE